MTHAHPVNATCRGANCDDAAALGLAEWLLCLAATPTFALMALLAGPLGGSRTEMLCLTAHGPALGGMVPMYLLMSVFHSRPWLNLLCGRRRDARPDRAPAAIETRSGTENQFRVASSAALSSWPQRTNARINREAAGAADQMRVTVSPKQAAWLDRVGVDQQAATARFPRLGRGEDVVRLVTSADTKSCKT